jgi:hypothetical protein
LWLLAVPLSIIILLFLLALSFRTILGGFEAALLTGSGEHEIKDRRDGAAVKRTTAFPTKKAKPVAVLIKRAIKKINRDDRRIRRRGKQR